MQIVIDVPEAAYTACKAVKNLEDNGSNPLMFCLMDVVAHGTVLPEKHGRIADMDEAIKCIEEVTGNDATYAISLIEWACSKRTILEAREESDTE